MIKCPPAMQETWVWSLSWEDPLEKEMATHSSILAWRIPWTEDPDRLQSMGSQRVRHNWATSLSFLHWGGTILHSHDQSMRVPVHSITKDYVVKPLTFCQSDKWEIVSHFSFNLYFSYYEWGWIFFHILKSFFFSEKCLDSLENTFSVFQSLTEKKKRK